MTFEEFCRMFVALRSCNMGDDKYIIDDVVKDILQLYNKDLMKMAYDDYIKEDYFNFGCPDIDTRIYIMDSFKIKTGCIDDMPLSCEDCWKRTIKWYIDNILVQDFWKVK